MNKIKNRLSLALLFISLFINAQNKKEIIHFEINSLLLTENVTFDNKPFILTGTQRWKNYLTGNYYSSNGNSSIEKI